jgi:chorismate dehydratase
LRVISAAGRALRIGCVKYLNAQPLIHGWTAPVVFDHPTALCEILAAGKLDVALVSSFEYLRNPIYSIVDGVAVAADGPVQSVFVAHLGKVDALEEIALDAASQTSVNLLRVLLAEKQSPARLTADSGAAAVSTTRGSLLIGDHAIRFRQQHGSEFSYWDLAEQWKLLTGLPFVFALWLLRPGAEGAEEVAVALRSRRDLNVAALDDVIAAQRDYSPEFCAYYFRDCLRFNLGDAEKQGLLMFRSLCQKHGILPHDATPLRLL